MALEHSADCLDDETLAALVSRELGSEQFPAVEAHLAGCADCRGVLADAVAATQSPDSMSRPPTNTQPSDLPAVGDLLAGKYRLEELIGHGAMGLVFAAEHVELGHRVAVKVLNSGEATAARRFLREAQTCARLVDDHIVRVFDLGRLENGVPYFVMEHLIGENLEQRMGHGPVPVSEALAYMRQACSGLTAAHAAGVIHRDLKPSNLFIVQRRDGPQRLKLLDFGMSKLLDPVGSRTGVTLPRTILGSPPYMSPEQSVGQKVDARTDIWSMGVILYELLTRQRPFRGATLPALLLAVATTSPSRPSSLVPDLPGGLDELVLGCLEKEPERRIPTVGALVDGLLALTCV